MQNKPIFDPVNRTLHDSYGKLLKHVNCPKLRSWQEFDIINVANTRQRLCDSCGKAVFDTNQMTSDEIVRAAKFDPSACFRIHLNQENIEIKVVNA